MTKRQANTLMALGLTITVTQILCTAVVLRGLDRTRRAAAQASAMAALEMREKSVEARRSTVATECEVIHPAPPVVIDIDGRASFLWDVPTPRVTLVPHVNNRLRISSGGIMIVLPPRSKGKE